MNHDLNVEQMGLLKRPLFSMYFFLILLFISSYQLLSSVYPLYFTRQLRTIEYRKHYTNLSQFGSFDTNRKLFLFNAL